MTDINTAERGPRRLSKMLFPCSPKSERGNFIRFVEESGANCVIMEALRVLNDQVQKPDDPIVWLTDYFRTLAPKRDTEVKGMKALLREKLLELEATILLLNEEEQAKIAQLNTLFKCNTPSGDSLPDPAEYHRGSQEQLRINTKWRLAPDPFLRATCSDEALKKRREDRKPDVLPEDDYYDDFYAGQDPFDQEYGGEGEFEDEDWLQAYNIYKDTSELPKKSSKTARIVDPLPTDLDAAEAEAEETEGELETPDNYPDRLPDDYWLPGFTLNPFRCEEISTTDRTDVSVCGENIDGCYKSSYNECKYIRRPHRSQIIFENDYDVWRTDLPDQEDPEEELDLSPSLEGKKSTNQEGLLAPPNTSDIFDDNVTRSDYSKMQF
ncbi:unnamed protein product [Allacma fusca]|uniref:Uncharacterized protein n=1 Tax=Allacma fusca TaxID=39272 RepID=A0A8J2K3U0_9HEXA|nr:unnamed protein product [Allacma fusca]